MLPLKGGVGQGLGSEPWDLAGCGARAAWGKQRVSRWVSLGVHPSEAWGRPHSSRQAVESFLHVAVFTARATVQRTGLKMCGVITLAYLKSMYIQQLAFWRCVCLD